jgi:undecaprenyl-diphosphatase
MNVFQAIIIAIVEGITEFLPVSSTGHMALTAAILGIEKDDFTKLFIENIQFGTIISVIIIYWRKFVNFKSMSFYLKLVVAFIPAAIVGVLLKSHIDEVLEKPMFLKSYSGMTLIGSREHTYATATATATTSFLNTMCLSTMFITPTSLALPFGRCHLHITFLF